MLDSIDHADRRTYIGGSDAPIIMGNDHGALMRLWKIKRGGAVSEDLSRNLVVQLGNATEDLNARWFEQEHSGLTLINRQARVQHPKHKFMGGTIDGIVAPDGNLFESKFMLPWSFDIEQAVAKHWWQLQHLLAVVDTKKAFLSIITGGGQYHCKEVMASATDQAILLDAEQKFWHCVENDQEPKLANAGPTSIPPTPVKIFNMNKSNAWGHQANIWLETIDAHGQHEDAKTALKTLMPADAKEARGHGIRAKRSKSGAVSFEEFVEQEVEDVA